MSAVQKCILGVIVLCCLVQFIEMSRIRREGESPTADLTNAVNSLLEKLKGALEDDSVKKLLDSAGKALAEGGKTMNDQLKDITSKLGSESE